MTALWRSANNSSVTGASVGPLLITLSEISASALARRMSKEALAGVVRAQPSQIVYVSCDVATLARDTRTLLDAGYELGALTGLDLFPNTAHVENVAVLSREITG